LGAGTRNRLAITRSRKRAKQRSASNPGGRNFCNILFPKKLAIDICFRPNPEQVVPSTQTVKGIIPNCCNMQQGVVEFRCFGEKPKVLEFTISAQGFFGFRGRGTLDRIVATQVEKHGSCVRDHFTPASSARLVFLERQSSLVIRKASRVIRSCCS